MTVFVTDDHTNLDAMDNATDQDSDGNVWGNTGQASTSIKVQGTGANFYQAKGLGTGTAGKFNSGNNFNLSNTHLYTWFRSLDYLDLESSGGYRVRVTNDSLSGNSNYGEWTIGGRDTRRAGVEGFIAQCVDTSRTFDFTTGTPPALTSVDGIGIGGVAVTQSGQNTFYVDQFKTGSLITISSGTNADPGVSSEVAVEDETDGRGSFKNIGGVYYVLSGLTFGASAAADSFFRDENEVWVFENQNVSNSFYTLNFQGSSGSTNEFSIGTQVGSSLDAVGVGGNTLVANGAPFTIVTTSSDIDVNLYGGNFLNSTTPSEHRIEQPNATVLSGLWSSMGQTRIRNGPTFRGLTVTDSVASSTEGALDLGSSKWADDTIRDLQIQNCSKGVLLSGNSTSAEFDFKNFTFANNTNNVRVDFASTDNVVINLLEGGTVFASTDVDNVNGTTLTVNASVTLTFEAVDDAGDPIEAVLVTGYVVDGGSKPSDVEVINDTTNASGIATASYSGAQPEDIYYRYRKSSSTDTKYEALSGLGTIEAGTGLSVKRSMKTDTKADPAI